MIDLLESGATDAQEEIAALVRRLQETQQRLLELTGGELDAVVQPDGQYYLLHEAQERLRQSEVNLRTSNQLAEEASGRLAKVLDSSLDAICTFDAEGRFVQVSAACKEIWGYEAAELLGTPYIERVLAEDQPATLLAAAAIVAGNPTKSFENRYVRKDKSITHILWSARWSETDQQMFCVARDITERKKLEQQFFRAQRMDSLGTLAGGIAHDLNNILAPILMSIDILTMISTHPQAKEILATIEVSARRGADIVRQVLSFARGVEGDKSELDPRPLVSDLTTIIRDTFPKNIRLKSIVREDVWSVLGNATQVHQILLNLCVNARDAMPRGGELNIVVENRVLDKPYVGMSFQVKPGNFVQFSVSDSGSGMSADVVEKIFEPFFTTKGLDEGTGLGLSTVLAIAKSHGGAITVYSEPGQGTTFEVYLPATEHSAAASKRDTASVELPRGRGEVILVVDDEPAILLVTKQTLEVFGYRVLTAANGAQAVAVFTAHESDIAVVLTDMAMPIMDGEALIATLLKLNPALHIIGASGLKAGARFTKQAESSVRHFLTKPYSSSLLLKALRNILD